VFLILEKWNMNRILKILILIAIASVFAVSVTADNVYAGNYSIAVPDVDVRSGDTEAGLDGVPADDEGDPDGMDDTNDGPAMAAPTGMSSADWAEYLLLILTQMQYMGL
jgi:hypothetical protein